MKKRLLFLGAICVAITAFSAFVTTYSQPVGIGPYFNTKEKYVAATGGAPGGEVRVFKNGVDTLIVGDVVYQSAINTVRKSTTLVNYNSIAGVVVGGTRTAMSAATTVPTSTDTAAYANQQVLVMTSGRTWVRIDAAAPIVAGTLIIPSTTVAGKVKGNPGVIDSFYRAIGRLIDTGVVSTQVLAHVNVK
jgi:hypothetical protein